MQCTINFPEHIGKKVCCKCKTEKLLLEFHNNKSKKDGKANACIPCNRSWMKPKTKEQALRDTKKYALAHPEKVKKRRDAYYKKNKEILNKKRIQHINGKGKEVYKKWYDKTRDHRNELRRIRKKNMPPKQKIEKVLRDRFHKVIVKMKKGDKLCSWRDLIGCTVLKAKEHIESQFVEGMSWDNHGNGEGKWNIDHIKPLYSFNLFDLEQQKIAFHYTNTRPLWFKDNMGRSKKEYPKG